MIIAERLTFPATTISPVAVSMSAQSIGLNCLPTLLSRIAHKIPINFTNGKGPDAVPPNPAIDSPYPRTHTVEYENDFPVTK